MKIFLSADMEGTCGIVSWPETDRPTPMDYVPLQKQMTREVAAACEGALSGGAEEVFVKDAHDSARNIDPAQLPRNTRIHRAWSGDLLTMMCGLDKEKFDGVIFTGYHAWAGCPGNPLSHTMNRLNNRVTLNGMPCSEFMLNSYTAGYFGVPVVMVTGDEDLCAFAKEWIPGITTVPVNRGRGGGAVSIHPDEAVERIREAAAKAVKNAAQCRVSLPEHFHMEIHFVNHTKAYSKHFYPGATLKEGNIVCFDHHDWYEMLRFCHFVLSDS